MLTSTIGVCIPFSILWINKTLGACHVHVLGNHSSRRTLFCLFNYHISKLKYVVFAKQSVQTKHRYERSNLVVVKPLNIVVNSFPTCRPFRRCEHLCLFLYRYMHHAFGESINLQTLISCMDTIFGSHGIQPFNGVRAHQYFFACSWSIIVQQQSLVLKSFIWLQVQPNLRGSIGTSISGATTLCIHGSNESRSRFRNHFRCCATLIISLKFNNYIEFYCPPT